MEFFRKLLNKWDQLMYKSVHQAIKRDLESFKIKTIRIRLYMNITSTNKSSLYCFLVLTVCKSPQLNEHHTYVISRASGNREINQLSTGRQWLRLLCVYAQWTTYIYSFLITHLQSYHELAPKQDVYRQIIFPQNNMKCILITLSHNPSEARRRNSYSRSSLTILVSGSAVTHCLRY